MRNALSCRLWILISSMLICGSMALSGEGPVNSPPGNAKHLLAVEASIRDAGSGSENFDRSLATLACVRSNGWKSLLGNVIRHRSYAPERRKRCFKLYMSQYFVPGMSLSTLIDDGIVKLEWINAVNAAAVSQLPFGLVESSTDDGLRNGEQLLIVIRPDFMKDGEPPPIYLICDLQEYKRWRQLLAESSGKPAVGKVRVTVNVISCDME